MERLELKYLASYLPYKLDVQIIAQPLRGEIHKLAGINYDGLASLGDGGMFGFIQRSFDLFLPILRPLSDITKEIEINGEKFVPIDVISDIYPIDIDENGVCSNGTDEFGINYLPYIVIEKLYECNFDVHDLIKKGLAIDINTFQNEQSKI